MKKLITFFQQLFCKHHYRYTEINHNGMNTVECKYCGKRKSVVLFITLALVMCGCVKSVGSSRVGKRMPVPIEEGATRLTITTDYIIVETCDGINNFEMPFWRCDKIMNNDSIKEELIRKINEQ